jgi:2,3-dimethylmalate lyase
MIFVEAVDCIVDMKRINSVLNKINVPSMANMVVGGVTPILFSAELEKLGYSIVVYPCSSVYTLVKSIRKMANYLKKNGTTNGFERNMIDFSEYFNFIGTADIRKNEKCFFE